jgi:hypothetical protein
METVAPQNRPAADHLRLPSPAARFAHDSGTILHFFPDPLPVMCPSLHLLMLSVLFYIYNQSAVVKIASPSRSNVRAGARRLGDKGSEEGSNVSRW